MATKDIKSYLPVGEILEFKVESEEVSPEKYAEIRAYLTKATGIEPSYIVGPAWNDETCLYPGTMPKRFARWYFKSKDYRMSEEMKKTIGDMASQGIIKSRTYYFDFTDKIDWTDGAYGDRGACFLTSDTRRRSMAMYGVWAMRFYNDTKKKGIARCWLVFPTEESTLFTDDGAEFQDKDNIVVACNAYHGGLGLNLSRMATILQNWSGLKSKRVRVTNAVNEVFYTNGEIGYQEHQNEKDKYSNYMFYPKEITDEKYKELSVITLGWDGKPIRECQFCKARGKHTRIWDANPVCENCWETQFFRCFNCDYKPVSMKRAIKVGDNEWVFCADCAETNTHTCAACGATGIPDSLTRSLLVDGERKNVCMHHGYQYCATCMTAYLVGHPCHPEKKE